LTLAAPAAPGSFFAQCRISAETKWLGGNADDVLIGQRGLGRFRKQL
jgi:hypothetical protein